MIPFNLFYMSEIYNIYILRETATKCLSQIKPGPGQGLLNFTPGCIFDSILYIKFNK